MNLSTLNGTQAGSRVKGNSSTMYGNTLLSKQKCFAQYVFLNFTCGLSKGTLTSGHWL